MRQSWQWTGKGFRFANTITINTYYEKYNELSKLVVEWFNFFSQYQVGILTPDPANIFFLDKKRGEEPLRLFVSI